jgi:hypothetical protein
MQFKHVDSVVIGASLVITALGVYAVFSELYDAIRRSR